MSTLASFKKIYTRIVISCLFMTALFAWSSCLYAQAVQFPRTLQMGDRGEDVLLLQEILNRDPRTVVATTGPGSPGQETTYFGILTKQAVISFQAKYRNEILVPAGVSVPTGFVGTYTRAMLVVFLVYDVNPSPSVISQAPPATPSPSVTPPSAITPLPTPPVGQSYSLNVFRAGYGELVGTNIACGSDCEDVYLAGTSVILQPIANPGWRFAFWTGACSGTGNCSVYMDGPHVVTATFQQIVTPSPMPITSPITPPTATSLPSTPPSVSPAPPLVAPPPNPSIFSFSASPGYISLGQISTLSWNVVGATSVSIDHGIGIVPSVGTKLVIPSQPTTYTLSAYNGTTLAEHSATVLIGAPPDVAPVTPPIVPPVQPPIVPPVTPPTPPQIVATMPGQIINLANWKLTLPTNGAEEVKQPALATYINGTYFSVTPEGDAVRFRAPVNGETTGGSSYPRSELREMINNGAGQAAWSSGSGTHTLFIDQAVTALPNKKPWITVGQVHDSNDDVIVIKLRTVSASALPTDPRRLTIDTGGITAAVLDPNYVLGTRFTVKFVVNANKTEVYYNGATTPSYVYNKSYSGGYFKVGAYTQSNCSTEGTCSADVYGEVKVYATVVTHS